MRDSHKKEQVIAIVPAAGLGRRFGPGTNKPFQPLDGKPLIIWSLEKLESVEAITEIIPVLKAEDRKTGQKIFKEHSISKIKKIAPGGRERQDSVYNGLKAIKDKNSIVLIHDGARPLIDKNLIIKTIEAFFVSGSGRGKQIEGVILGVPVKDTIKEAREGIIRKTLLRSSLWAIQTPQIFQYKTILDAYEKAMREGFYATDDAALLEKYGAKIKVIMGSYRNIKITTQEDLEIAEFLVRKIDQN